MTLTRLYNVPNNTQIRIPGTKSILTFYHVDGMYSLCKTSNGETVHLAAWTEVEVVE